MVLTPLCGEGGCDIEWSWGDAITNYQKRTIMSDPRDNWWKSVASGDSLNVMINLCPTSGGYVSMAELFISDDGTGGPCGSNYNVTIRQEGHDKKLKIKDFNSDNYAELAIQALALFSKEGSQEYTEPPMPQNQKEELTVSNMYHLEALSELLEEAGIVTKEQILERKKVISGRKV
jgi:hypothetical protein